MSGFDLVQFIHDAVDDFLRIEEPVNSPDAHEVPSQSLKHAGLADLAVALGVGPVVVGSITDDAHQVVVRICGVDHGQVDLET